GLQENREYSICGPSLHLKVWFVERLRCQERGMPVMAYCPVGQGGRLLRHPALGEIAARHDASSAQVALAWLLEQGVIAIPKAVTSAHIRQNAAAADLELSADDLRALDQAFPPPTRKRNLAIV
ncbi:aldo/keto reductase, partial [Pseudomonas aeruginosa]|nr:aldo/keto reductase [Pseudomonas aeruginosa]MCS8259611.1 aldo/keto reductase [Pseudomonas aeruginosa]MCS8758541.1 aldo/keto reductase [Pseudomonas aeruginosa]